MLPDPNLAVPAPLSALRPHPDNPRTISRERFAALVASLRADPGHLWQRPLGARRDGTVYLGNMRLLAARELGWSAIPVVYEDLPEAEERLRLLRDNREYGEDDERAVAEMLHGLQSSGADVLLSGFDPKQLTALLDSVGGAMPAGDDADLEPPEEPVTKPGDLWTLGEHRLLCGDSTEEASHRRVLAGESVDLVLTDPPYGVGVEYASCDDTEERLCALLGRALPLLRRWPVALLTPGVTCLWCYPRPTWLLAWVHPAPVGRGPWGFHGLNPVLAYGPDPKLAAGLGSYPDVLVLAADREGVEGHPTPKPPRVWEWLMDRGTARPNQLVLDPFAGSGTSVVAAERLGHRCAAIELDPGYCDVAVRRWEALTGRVATIERREAVTA